MSNEDFLTTPGEPDDFCEEDGPFGYVCARPKDHPLDLIEPHAGWSSGGMIAKWGPGIIGVKLGGTAWIERLAIRTTVDRAMGEEP